MIKADYTDRDRVVDILRHSFDDNKSVNYIIPQDKFRKKRIQRLMEYSFDICFLFGNIFLSEDKKACALIVLPDKKKETLRSTWLNIKLIFSGIGVRRIVKAIKREKEITRHHPENPIYYLWFIGVELSSQSQGIGSRLLQEILQDTTSKGRTICLETSTKENIPWYQKFGFCIYKELDFGYMLFCMKSE